MAQLVELQLVVFLDLCLGREVIHLHYNLALQPAQEALYFLLLLLVHLQHLLGQERQQVVDHVGLLLLRNEVTLGIFGLTGIDAGKNFFELPSS